jgi:hypothetical protein
MSAADTVATVLCHGILPVCVPVIIAEAVRSAADVVRSAWCAFRDEWRVLRDGW